MRETRYLLLLLLANERITTLDDILDYQGVIGRNILRSGMLQMQNYTSTRVTVLYTRVWNCGRTVEDGKATWKEG